MAKKGVSQVPTSSLLSNGIILIAEATIQIHNAPSAGPRPRLKTVSDLPALPRLFKAFVPQQSVLAKVLIVRVFYSSSLEPGRYEVGKGIELSKTMNFQPLVIILLSSRRSSRFVLLVTISLKAANPPGPLIFTVYRVNETRLQRGPGVVG